MPTPTNLPRNSGKQEPSPYTEPDQDSSALSPREQQTVAGLRRLDPQLAGLYELGWKLVNEIEKPGYAHSVAYVARELSRGVIRCRLRDEGIETLVQNAAKEGCAADGERNRHTIAAALQLPEDDPRVTQWLQMPTRFAKWEKYRYGGPSPDDVREAFEQFSQMLFGLVAPYYATEARLDSLLSVEAPTSEHARRLRDLQLRPAQRRHFFGHLKDPQWLKHLAHQGFFAKPPGREVHDDGSWSPRPWPEGDYLIRIASEAPAEVVNVLAQVPSTNDNPEVWNSVAKAASQLPADFAVRVVPALTSALESVPGLSRWSDSVVELIEYLAESGSSEAFALADHLLFIAGAATADVTDTAFRNRTDWVFPRLGGQDWRGKVDRVVAALEGTNPERTLCLLLSKVSRVQDLVDTLPTGPEYPLPPRVKTSLEDSLTQERRNHLDADTVTILGRSTVGVARRLATTSREAAAGAFALLKQKDGRFFAHLRCHVLRFAGHFLPSQLDQFLLSEEIRNPGYPATEVAALLRAQFRNASAPARRAYAAAVEVGPDRDELRAGLAWSHETVTDADVEHQLRRRQQRILTFFRGDVPQELHDLVSQLGLEGVTPSRRDQQMAEQGVYSESGVREFELDTVHSLTGRVVEEVAEILREDGSAGFIALQEYAKEQPTDGVRILAKCADGDVALGNIDGVLFGLADAVKAGAELDWALVLHSQFRVIRQVGAQEAPGAARLAQWRRVWDYGARLIHRGCVEDAIPPEYAREVWDALEDSTRLPTVWLGSARDQTKNLDGVLSDALNDGAGTVASAVIAAGLWQYRSCLQGRETSSEEEKAAARALVQRRLVPVLDALLNVGGPNRAVPRAVIGQSLPWLFLLVPEWLDRHTDRLLDGGLEDPLAHPGWTAYIIRDALYGAVFEALRPWYLRAANNAAIWKSKLERVAQRPRNVTKRFARHLVTAFLRGWIRRGDDDELLEIAYANLSSSDWSYAYFRVSRAFRATDGPVPSAVIERLVELWEWRNSEMTHQRGTEATTEEAKGLSRFLSTPHIPAEAVVRFGPATARRAEGGVRLDWGELLELARSNPEGAFEIADAVLGGTLRARYGYVPVDDVKPLLAFVLQTAEAEVQERVRGLIDRLGEHSYRDFKDLLHDE